MQRHLTLVQTPKDSNMTKIAYIPSIEFFCVCLSLIGRTQTFLFLGPLYSVSGWIVVLCPHKMLHMLFPELCWCLAPVCLVMWCGCWYQPHIFPHALLPPTTTSTNISPSSALCPFHRHIVSGSSAIMSSPFPFLASLLWGPVLLSMVWASLLSSA